jgi:hypothetical protein
LRGSFRESSRCYHCSNKRNTSIAVCFWHQEQDDIGNDMGYEEIVGRLHVWEHMHL